MSEKPVVFVITSDKSALDILERAVRGTGMLVVAGEKADRAAAEAKLASPDLVVLDDAVEGPDWLELYGRLREELSFTFIPILVLLSAETAEESIEKMAAGLVDVLVKPLNLYELRARLSAMLQIKNIHDQLDTERIELQKKLEEERKLREQLTSINEELKRLSTTDGLTGVANYRYMTNWLSTEFEIASRYKMPLSAIMIDLDNFKEINDRCGHPFGDFVLKQVAQIITGKSRRADFTARYGGDEFLVVLPNTGGEAAANLARRIHRAIEKHVFDDGQRRAEITASLGISTYPSDGVASSQALIDLADRSLYQAKASGRNRITSWSEIE